MKNDMKKFGILFVLILLTMTTCFSQNISSGIKTDSIVLITPNQLKETNLIFIEHQKLLEENDLLFKQVSNYKLDNELLIHSDSLRVLQLNSYEKLIDSYDYTIEQLNREIEKKDKSLLIWKIGGITVSSGLFVWLLLK